MRIFQAFGNDYRVAKARFDDILSTPFDVEPLRSKTVLFPVIISPVQPLRSGSSDTKEKAIGHLIAFDHHNHKLAKVALEIPVSS